MITAEQRAERAIKAQGVLIDLQRERIAGLEIENALLKQVPNRKAIKNKWGKVPYKKRHLKLIAVNGVPLKGGDL